VDGREHWLATVTVDLAEAFDADSSGTAYQHVLTARLAELLVPAEIGLLIADQAGRLTVAAASTDRAGELARLQVQQDDGPVIDSHRTARPVIEARIQRASVRWPRFAQAAARAGVSLVTALPMRRRDRTVGVIFAAAAGSRRLAAADVWLAQVLARTGAIAIAQQRELSRSVVAAERLQRALDSRVVIEQAKGAVAARLDITPDQAFELLRAHARRTSSLLAEVAGQVLSQQLAAPSLVPAGRAGRSSRPARRQPAGQS